MRKLNTIMLGVKVFKKRVNMMGKIYREKLKTTLLGSIAAVDEELMKRLKSF